MNDNYVSAFTPPRGACGACDHFEYRSNTSGICKLWESVVRAAHPSLPRAAQVTVFHRESCAQWEALS
jgi:hypothetical protein